MEAMSGSGARRFFTTLVCLGLLIAPATPSGAYIRPGRTELATVSSEGTQGRPCLAGVGTDPLLCNSDWVTSLSANGRYVAFSSPATGLVMLDTNLQADVFVHDRKTGDTERVSVSSNGAQGVAPPASLSNKRYLSDDPSINASGRYVAFTSQAINLVPGDTNNHFDVFVHDRRTGGTERVSVNSQGEQTSGFSTQPSISADGRFVSFSSPGSNLVPGDTNQQSDVFVHDRKTNRTKRVSVATGGRESVTACTECLYGEFPLMSTISASGQWIVFDSLRTDLVDGDTNRLRDVFVHDRETDRTERVSVASDGEQGVDTSVRLVQPNPWAGSFLTSASPSGSNGRNISDDGRYIVFASTATNLIPNDTNGGDSVQFDDGIDVFLHDRKTHRTSRLSVVSTGEQDLIGHSLDASQNLNPSISRDGRFVTWHSSGFLVPEPRSEAVAGIETGVRAILVHDLETGATELASWMAGNRPQDRGGGDFGGGLSPEISNGGRYVSYQSPAWHENSTEDKNPDEYDVFVRDRGSLLGVGGFGESGSDEGEEPDEVIICLTPDLCIPPGAAISSSDGIDDVDDALTKHGANLYGASLAYRPQYEDLFAAIDLEYMPMVPSGLSPVFYGLRFNIEDTSYEVRATSLLGGTFGLFDCTGSLTCSKVADLRGGYGTTGMRVVFSLPLVEIGLKSGGRLSEVTVFSGLGTYLTGATEIFDRVAIK